MAKAKARRPNPLWGASRRLLGAGGLGIAAAAYVRVDYLQYLSGLVARAAATCALGGAGTRLHGTRAVLSPMGRRAPRRAALPRLHRLHARHLPLK